MRDIKFRAWVAEHKAMTEGVQPNFTKLPELYCMVPDRMLTVYEPMGEKGYWYTVTVDAIMQFTGLLDKNGKEIYEGDILKYSYSRDTTGTDIIESTDIVEWDEMANFSGWSIQMTLNPEIIGNIYENPELK